MKFNDIALLSYTRSCLYKHKQSDNRHPFRGSSLCRPRAKRKEKIQADEGQEALPECDAEYLAAILDEDGNALPSLSDDTETQTDADSTSRHRTLSARTRAKLRNKAWAFMYTKGLARKTTINFLTLTFINYATDRLAHKTLNKFLTRMRTVYGDFNYLWVAERQDGKRCTDVEFATNNIHYHLLIDIIIDIKYCNSLWVIQQYNSGLRHSKLSFEQAMIAHDNRTMHKHFNPLDIKPIRNLKAASSYLAKYISKNESTFETLVWHCSRGVSRLATTMEVPDDVFHECSTSVNTYIDRNTGKAVKPEIQKHYNSNGNLIAQTVAIVNKEHFHRNRLQLLDAINLFFLNLDYSKIPPDFPYPIECINDIYNLN